jgi:hypothetical protein
MRVRRRVLFLCVAILVFTAIVTPVLAANVGDTSARYGSTGPYITRYYHYFLDGRPGTLPFALSTKVYEEYLGKKPRENTDNASYFLSDLNDPDQELYFETLADEIRAEIADPDDQARIAISLVQHIPYQRGSPYRYPYEVLYEGSGVCQEKSILLAALLRELGFKSSVMYFVRENHMAVGISCPDHFDFQESGYCMVEATNVVIITDDTSYEISGEGWSVPEIYPTSDGRSLESVSREYNGARTWIDLQAKSKISRESGTILSTDDSLNWYRLQAKYDLN